MLEMAMHSIVLFWKGKLFQDLGSVLRQAAIGIAVAAVLLLVFAQLIGLPLWLSVVVTSFIAGLYQPWLFKDLKYA